MGGQGMGGEPGDDMQGAALATGAAAMKSLLLQWSENRGGLCSGWVEVHSAKRECPSAVSVGEQAKVADLDEARGQDVEQEAADELDRIEGHDLDAVVVFGVAPAEAHLAVNEIEKPAVSDGDAVSIE